MAAHTDNAIEIAVPLAYAWERMMDIEGWPSLFSEYAKAEVIEREGNRIVFRLTTHPDPDYNGQVWSWTSERVADPATHSSKSRRIETGPFQYMNIEWYFEETGDGGTRMRWVQDFSMKPEAPANDEQAEQYMNKNTKEQMRVIKERLETGAGESPGAAA
jgi:aromatase